MDERFLHYIWRSQEFDHHDLRTVSNEPLSVYNPGTYNENSGPDFFGARVRIADLVWVGRVEIHHKASNWMEHRHQYDENYKNVILHVVWEDDKEIVQSDGELIPTLELKHRISSDTLSRYTTLIKSPDDVVCSPLISRVSPIQAATMLHRTMVERIEQKAEAFRVLLKDNLNDWEETTYQMIARAFGGHLNQENFVTLAKSTPLKVLAKHQSNPGQIAALLFGQAGFLDPKHSVDEYASQLGKEYRFLTHKYDLECRLSRFQWRFHRTRPSSFPTVRIVQLAQLLHHNTRLFHTLIRAENVRQITDLLKQDIPGYWTRHFDFGKPWKGTYRGIGNDFVARMVINAIVPTLAAASLEFDDPEYMERALAWIECLKPEKNKYTRRLENAGLSIKNAGDSQGALQLYQEYCIKKRCLDCNIGVSLVKAQ